jgi:NAD-dependent dihydropyrimidine dehydrogenase PreA subunit/bacterioferritin-associated ferredoxin
MKIVEVQAEVDKSRCNGCKTCEMVCPVYAVSVKRIHKKPVVNIALDICVGCWSCEQRCPEHAIRMVACTPFTLSVNVNDFDYSDIETLCRKAHVHPKQLVCYCTATRAEEVAAAVIGGAHTPDKVVRACGIGAGCGIECNQPILRFLEAADCSFERKKNSFQWYGRTVTVWDVSQAVKDTHPSFRFDDDRDLLERVVNAPVKHRNKQ